MSLANAFASRTIKRRKGPSGVTLNPQAAAQTMFTQQGAGGGMDSMSIGITRHDDDDDGFGSFIDGDDQNATGEEGGTGQGGDGRMVNGKRKGLGDEHDEHATGSTKRPRGDEDEEGSELDPANGEGDGLNGLTSLNSTFGLAGEDDGHSAAAGKKTQRGAGGIEDYNLPLGDIGTYGNSIDDLELQRFLGSTGTSPVPPSTTLPPTGDEDHDNEAIPPPPPPRLEAAEASSPQLEEPSSPALENSDDEDDDDDAPPPPPMLDQSNLPELPNLANLPDLPDLQVSGIPGSLEAPLRANYTAAYNSIDPSLRDADGNRAASQDQVEMIRQIFNINPAEEFDIMATHENSPVPHSGYEMPIDPALSGGIDDGSNPHLNLSLNLAPPAPAPKSKKKKAKTKKEKLKEAQQQQQQLADEYAAAQQSLWVEPAPPPPPQHQNSLDPSLSPGAYSRSDSLDPVASGSGSTPTFAKPKMSKSGSKSKNPIIRVINERAPTPRNPNGSAPGASDFAPPDGGLTAREAASLFKGDEEHAHPCPHVNCDKAFTRKSDFLRHYRIHTGERPFVCSHMGCGKSFIQRSALTVHERVHSGEKPHTCEDCQRQFSDSSSLARHRRIHQGLKPFKCEMCGTKSFSRRATLTRHQNICPGRVEGMKMKSLKPGRKGKHARIHPSVQFPGDGDIPPPPGHAYYGMDESYDGSMSPGGDEPNLSAQLGGSMDGEEDYGDYDEDEDAEGDDDDYEDIVMGHGGKVDDRNLPPIPSTMGGPSPAVNHLNLPTSTTVASPSISPRLNATQDLSGAPAVENGGEVGSSTTEVQAAPAKASPAGGKQTKAAKKKAEKEAAEREAAAVAAAARALDLSHAIDPSLGLEDGEEDPSIPEEQAAAVAALVEGFISPHIKAENLE